MVMKDMIPTRRQVGFSKWKRKAKRSTKPKEEDLHIAISHCVRVLSEKRRRMQRNLL